MAVVQAKPEAPKPVVPGPPRIDESLMKAGKYEITPETTFTVTIHAREKDGRWVLANGPGKGIETNTVVFRLWSYDEMIELRKMATNFDKEKRIHMIDPDTLNRLKIQRLMLSWTFDKDNPRLRLWHVNGVLTDEAWRAFAVLQPNLSSFIIDEMNRVYEFNG